MISNSTKMNYQEPLLKSENTNSHSENQEVESTTQEDITDFPGYSQYIEKQKWGINYVYFPDLQKYFLGHWEVRPKIPLAVILLSISSYFVLLFLGLKFFNLIEIVIVLLISFLLLSLFLYCLIMIIVIGPGYYPFSLLHDNGNPPTQWAGIQTTKRQFEWVKLQGRPPRAIFSQIAHRYVIRPDHFCDWAASWIGKRNGKFFILFNMYGMLYLSLFSVYIIRALIILCSKLISIPCLIIATLYTLLGAGFATYTAKFFFEAIYHSIRNITNLEIWHKYDVSCFNKHNWKENMQDVFGRDSMFKWLMPTSPFKHQSNAEISCDYISYDLCS